MRFLNVDATNLEHESEGGREVERMERGNGKEGTERNGRGGIEER